MRQVRTKNSSYSSASEGLALNKIIFCLTQMTTNLEEPKKGNLLDNEWNILTFKETTSYDS